MDKTKITIELRTPSEIPEAARLVCVILKDNEGDKWLSAIYSEERGQFLDNVHFDPIIDEIDFWFYLPPLGLDNQTEEETDANSLDSGSEAEESPSPQEDLLPTIQSRLTQRAKDLSLSIIKPETFARKLREELISIAGPQAAIAYHIGARYDAETNQLTFQLARLSPSLAIKLSATLQTSQLEIAYTGVIASGWKVAVGLNAKYFRDEETLHDRFTVPEGSDLTVEFGVTLSK